MCGCSNACNSSKALHFLQGDVLEVSAGTGRNLGYYNSQHVNSLTMTDISKYMLWHAIQKHDKNNPKLNAKFCLADAQQLLSDSGAVIAAAEPDNYHEHVSTSHVSSKFQGKLETFNPAQFDTVVDTFGLCSHEDPKTALKVKVLHIASCSYILGFNHHASADSSWQ